MGASWPCVELRGAANPAKARIRLPQRGASHVRGTGGTLSPQPGSDKRHSWPRARKSPERLALQLALIPCLSSCQEYRPAGRLRQGPGLDSSSRSLKTINYHPAVRNPSRPLRLRRSGRASGIAPTRWCWNPTRIVQDPLVEGGVSTLEFLSFPATRRLIN